MCAVLLAGNIQSFSSATAERDEFKAGFNNLKNIRDRLQANYGTLKQQSDQLRTSYNDMQRNLEGLQIKHSNVTATKDRLQAKYSNLQRQKDELQTRFGTLIANRDQLQSNYSSLRRDKDQLQRSYNALSTSKNNIETSYNSLWKEKDQLQSRYNSLLRTKDRSQTNYSSLLADRDKLQDRIERLKVKLRRKILLRVPCKLGWKKFDISCYFISTMKRNWTESRKSCKAQGTDLVVIESREEQVRKRKMLGRLKLCPNSGAGILQEAGFTDRCVSQRFWQIGQPNSYSGNQDCAEIVQDTSVGEWNDDGCFAEQIWICEN
uniref:CD209 antigen-like protein E n=1 Tax=Seriola lalandi dorsalis TaxID=1841481 RepID=A0A3B4YYV3_SERLL